ncbi:hypothetical protein M426DRAFT_79470 [Hypoxylon sp. CI-4A]|nr:hypothetical protein M426DRAFT_79470 [Hypoxylon sp. CI-4A]
MALSWCPNSFAMAVNSNSSYPGTLSTQSRWEYPSCVPSHYTGKSQATPAWLDTKEVATPYTPIMDVLITPTVVAAEGFSASSMAYSTGVIASSATSTRTTGLVVIPLDGTPAPTHTAPLPISTSGSPQLLPDISVIFFAWLAFLTIHIFLDCRDGMPARLQCEPSRYCQPQCNA